MGIIRIAHFRGEIKWSKTDYASDTGRCPVLMMPPFQGYLTTRVGRISDTGRCPVLMMPPFQGCLTTRVGRISDTGLC
ncbi:MAG: hypothetical protein LBK18_01120 [Prevotellaceae bacterium]|nr:hypothetical protein [Prevotellaceae bacterium]